MSFTRAKPSGWTDDIDTITAAQINQIDVNQSRAVDGVAGGLSTPTPAIEIGGDGLIVSGSAEISGDALVSGTVTQTGLLDISSGAGIKRDYNVITGSATFDISIGGDGVLEGYYRVNTSVFNVTVNLPHSPAPPNATIATITKTSVAGTNTVTILDNTASPIATLAGGLQGWVECVYSATENAWRVAKWGGSFAIA